MKTSQFYIEVDRARTSHGRKCNSCGEKIKLGEKYLHCNRNSHLFVLCGKCLVIYATKVIQADPCVKGDAMAELI